MPRTPGFSDNGLVTRRNLLKLGAGLAGTALLVGCGVETKPTPTNPNTPTASAPSTPGASETTTPNRVVLDPTKVREMTPAQRLEAVRIPKELLNNPDELIPYYTQVVEDIYNCGSDMNEFLAWREKNTTSDTYVDYVVATYYIPLAGQVFGRDLSKTDQSDPLIKTMRIFANRMEISLMQHHEMPERVPHVFHLKYTLSDIKKSGDNIAYKLYMQDGLTEAEMPALRQYASDFNVMTNEAHDMVVKPSYNETTKTVVIRGANG